MNFTLLPSVAPFAVVFLVVAAIAAVTTVVALVAAVRTQAGAPVGTQEGAGRTERPQGRRSAATGHLSHA
ncbi:hypothetical protein [Nocardioides sp. GXZ039]|uniref:hypothetical protein n=1 Tax=Nocardioides sp. GXZ039 TaxID=3136018 RepID=UPI0030F3C834